MKTDLDHLPANKQRELERVKAIIFEEFEDALALGTMSWKKKGRIDKIILYGSYARGGWVDEPHNDIINSRGIPLQTSLIDASTIRNNVAANRYVVDIVKESLSSKEKV